MNTLTFGSLFAGIGGLDLGLERAGMECKWQVEIDEYARRVLAKHWPNVRRWDDVRTWPQPDTEPVDLICGGDPCQENSRARQTDYTRHPSLADQFIRIIDSVRPRFVLRENPPARTDAPWPWQRFRNELESLGYACLPFRLRACCLGFDHRRERVFVFAEMANTSRVRLEKSRKQEFKLNKKTNSEWKNHFAFDASGGATKPGVGRVAYGVPNRVDRLRGLGNAVVPQVAEYIGRQIMESIQ